MIRVALAQYKVAGSTGANLAMIEQLMERAGQENVDIICFSDNFLGFDVDKTEHALDKLLDFTQRFGMETVLGRIQLPNGNWAQSAFLSKDGEMTDSVTTGEIKTMRTCLGPTLVLTEPQAYDIETDAQAAVLKPKVMIMQTSAISMLELEAIKELAISRSYNQAHLVMCVSVVGQCRKEKCLGSSFAVFQGEILAEADTEVGELIIFSIDTSKFIEYDQLKDPVDIPDLLKEKYADHSDPSHLHFGAE